MSVQRLTSVPAERGTRDGQTVTADGRSVAPAIAGVVIRAARTIADERGELVELLSTGWPELGDPAPPHVYMATIQPGTIKGWICHGLQSDRVVTLFGRIRWVLYDGRDDSPTRGTIQQLTSTERARQLVLIPPGVWHAAQNVGTTEAAFVNLPTHPYRHDDPDKFRLPADSPEIPFDFGAP